MAGYLKAGDWPFGIKHAVQQIKETYGDTVYVKNKGLRKWGENPSVGTSFEDVWGYGGTEVLPTTNAIDYISSSSGSDTFDVYIEGHTISAGLLTFVTQTVTLTGTTPKALTTPLARATRYYNAGTAASVGTIYIHESDTYATPGVPDTASKVHGTFSAEHEQSVKAMTSISQSDYWLITEVGCGVQKNATASAHIEVQFREVAATPYVWRTQFSLSGNSAGSITTFDPPLIVPKNHDFKLRAYASTTGVEVYGFANGYLCAVQS